MATVRNNPGVKKFKRKKQLNIGVIIFGLIFIYLIATVIMYLMAPHVTVYEVRKGSVLKDTTYTGVAIRDEIVVQATESGYINYFAQDVSKVKAGSDVYTLTNEKLSFEETGSDEEINLTAEEKRRLALRIQEFIFDYDGVNFSEAYNLKNDLKASVGSLNSQTKIAQLNTMISQGNLSGANVYKTADDGIIVYSVDGMEDLTVETASLSHLNKTNYHKTEFSNNAKIKSGDNIYKIIANDTWTLMIELDKDTAEILKENTYVDVNFTKDHQITWAGFKLKQIDGHYLAYLTFDNSMIRYATERYINIELILEDQTGLKIPKTAKTEKSFYVVPMDYLSKGSDSSNPGVLVKIKDKNNNDIAKHMEVTIYHSDTKKEIVYLDPNQFDDDNVVLKKPDSNDVLQLSEMNTLDGVYCINKGYAVFKQIEILGESDAYYIIKEDSEYGLSNYDHIVSDSASIKENDVVL